MANKIPYVLDGRFLCAPNRRVAHPRVLTPAFKVSTPAAHNPLMVPRAANVALHSRTAAGRPRPRPGSQGTLRGYGGPLRNLAPPLHFAVIPDISRSMALSNEFPRAIFRRICLEQRGKCAGTCWRGREANWSSVHRQLGPERRFRDPVKSTHHIDSKWMWSSRGFLTPDGQMADSILSFGLQKYPGEVPGAPRRAGASLASA